MTTYPQRINLIMFGGELFWKTKVAVVIVSRIITRITADVPVLRRYAVMRAAAAVVLKMMN